MGEKLNPFTLKFLLFLNFFKNFCTSFLSSFTVMNRNFKSVLLDTSSVNFTNSGNILLTGDLSNFRIGFKYTGGYSPVRTTTYQIDNVRIIN